MRRLSVYNIAQVCGQLEEIEEMDKTNCVVA